MVKRFLWACCVRAAAAGLACAAAVCAQTLTPQLVSGGLSLKASRAVVLQGAVLERLHDGATVRVLLELALLSSARGPLHSRASARFALSYDLWEERYAVTRLGANPKSVSHLTAPEAEAWCLSELRLPVPALSPDSPFWIRLDVQPEQAGDREPPSGDVRDGLARLVELFSQPLSSADQHRRIEAGPFRLKELR